MKKRENWLIIFKESIEKQAENAKERKARLTREFYDKDYKKLNQHINEQNELKKNHRTQMDEHSRNTDRNAEELVHKHNKKEAQQIEAHNKNKEIIRDDFEDQLAQTKSNSKEHKVLLAKKSRDVIKKITHEFSDDRADVDRTVSELSLQKNNLEKDIDNVIDIEKRNSNSRVNNYKKVIDENAEIFDNKLNKAAIKMGDRVADLKKDFNNKLTNQRDTSDLSLKQLVWPNVLTCSTHKMFIMNMWMTKTIVTVNNKHVQRMLIKELKIF